MKVFVYGTLKKGFHNHRCLEGATFLKETHLTTPFRMFDTGGFPVLLPATENKTGFFPTGEVYELPEGNDGTRVLARLDALEGEGRMYHRQEFYTADDEIVSVYIGDDHVWRRLDNQAQLGRGIHVHDEFVSYRRRMNCYINNRQCDCKTLDYCVRDPFRSIDVEDEDLHYLETVTGHLNETEEVQG